MALNKRVFLLLIFLLFLAAGLRLYGLPQQGLIFSDEGAMVYQADKVWHNLFEVSGPRTIPQSFLNAKILWLLIVGMFQRIFDLYAEAGQIASFFAGVSTVLLLYFFVKQISGCKTLALWSSLLLAISGNHVFYSRIGMPEVTAGFVCLFSVFCFWSGSGRGRSVFGAGMLSCLNIFMLKYRALLFLSYPFLLGQKERQDSKKTFKAFFLFITGFISIILFVFLGLSLIRMAGISFPSLRQAFILSFHGHKAVFDLASVISFPYYLWVYETPLITVLFFSAILIKRAPGYIKSCWWIVIIQIIASTLADEKGIRSIAPVLPFFVIPAAWMLVNIGNYLKAELKLSSPFLIPFIVVLLNASLVLWPVINYRTDMVHAVNYIFLKDGGSKILSTNGYITAAYTNISLVACTDKRTTIDDLKRFYNDGYNYLIVEPLKFIRNTKSGQWNDPELMEMIVKVEKRCSPEILFDNFSRSLFERFAWEHTRPSFVNTAALLKATGKNVGDLRVYHIGQCLKSLQNDLSDY